MSLSDQTYGCVQQRGIPGILPNYVQTKVNMIWIFSFHGEVLQRLTQTQRVGFTGHTQTKKDYITIAHTCLQINVAIACVGFNMLTYIYMYIHTYTLVCGYPLVDSTVRYGTSRILSSANNLSQWVIYTIATY